MDGVDQWSGANPGRSLRYAVRWLSAALLMGATVGCASGGNPSAPADIDKAARALTVDFRMSLAWEAVPGFSAAKLAYNQTGMLRVYADGSDLGPLKIGKITVLELPPTATRIQLYSTEMGRLDPVSNIINLPVRDDAVIRCNISLAIQSNDEVTCALAEVDAPGNGDDT